jgi:hypothetical protein
MTLILVAALGTLFPVRLQAEEVGANSGNLARKSGVWAGMCGIYGGSPAGTADRAIDGNTSSWFHTNVQKNPWMIVFLGKTPKEIDNVRIYNRTDRGDVVSNRARQMTIFVTTSDAFKAPANPGLYNTEINKAMDEFRKKASWKEAKVLLPTWVNSDPYDCRLGNVKATAVMFQLTCSSEECLHLSEVEILEKGYGLPNPVEAIKASPVGNALPDVTGGMPPPPGGGGGEPDPW